MTEYTRIEEEDLVRLHKLKGDQAGNRLTESNQKIQDIKDGKRPYIKNKGK